VSPSFCAPMAKPPQSQIPDKPNKKNLVTVKLDGEVHRAVKTLCAWLGVEVTDWLHSVVAPRARAELAKILKDQASGQD
jgi:hypothetical protein